MDFDNIVLTSKFHRCLPPHPAAAAATKATSRNNFILLTNRYLIRYTIFLLPLFATVLRKV